MKNATSRKRMILDHLLMQDGWTTSMQLAQRLDVSDRTIRKEMTDLVCDFKPYCLSIASARGKGYSISDEDKKRLYKLLYVEKAFGFQENCPAYAAILQFLLAKEGNEDIDDLADRFFYSRKSIENELRAIKEYLERYGSRLILSRRKNAVSIDGPEKEKRFILNSLFVSNGHSKLPVDLKAYTPYFEYQELLFCRNVLIKLFREYDHDLKLTDTSLVAIVIHVLISLKRIRQGFMIKESCMDEKEGLQEDNVELAVAHSLWNSLEAQYHIEANVYEREATAYQISLRRVFFAEGMKIEDLDGEPTREYLQLARTIVAELRDIYLLDLTRDNDLLVGLTTHLKSLVDRVHFRSHYANPILKDFKDQYPFVFELAIYARQRIIALKHIDINEDEVGYLAIHFGASVERLKHMEKQGRICAALVCHTGYSTSQFLLTKLKSVFGEQLALIGPFSTLDTEALAKEAPQLILATTNIGISDIPFLLINPLLDRQDIRQIGRMIEQIDKRCFSMERMRHFFHEDYFYAMLPYKTSDEIIGFMADKLMQSGHVLPTFKKLVFERENFSPTVIQNAIALPHPSAFCSLESKISIATLPRAVDWHGRKVQLVFLMAIKEGDQRYLKDFYEFIVDLSEDAFRVQRLLRIRNLNAFWQFMVENNNRRAEENG